MINYYLNKDTGVLSIYNGYTIMADIPEVDTSLSDKDLEDFIEDVLYDMGYNWLKNGEIEKRPVKSTKFEILNGVYKNSALKSEDFMNKIKALVSHIEEINGRGCIHRLTEIDSCTFSVSYKKSKKENVIYKVYKRKPKYYSFSLCKKGGFWIYIESVNVK